MAFYNKWHCKFSGIKGFVNAYEDGLKYRMLTEKSKYKVKVLIFWEKHGLKATKELHLTHYHTYPKAPKMNAHIETFQPDYTRGLDDWHLQDLLDPDSFNNSLMDYLIWYNTETCAQSFSKQVISDTIYDTMAERANARVADSFTYY